MKYTIDTLAQMSVTPDNIGKTRAIFSWIDNVDYREIINDIADIMMNGEYSAQFADFMHDHGFYYFGGTIYYDPTKLNEIANTANAVHAAYYCETDDYDRDIIDRFDVVADCIADGIANIVCVIDLIRNIV